MLKKDIEYYKNLEYSVIVEKQEQDGEIWYIAYSTELGKFACYGRGETQVDALNNFNEEKETFIEFLFNEGNEIPEPKNREFEKFSGVFNVRTSPLIHSNLVYQAKEMEVSLNLYVNQIISAAIGKKDSENEVLNKLAEICGKLDAHHFEITKHLRYQKEIIKGKNEWLSEYGDPYLKTA